jgi:hypothetical protein
MHLLHSAEALWPARKFNLLCGMPDTHIGEWPSPAHVECFLWHIDDEHFQHMVSTAHMQWVLMVRSTSLMASPAHVQCFLWHIDDEHFHHMVSTAHMQWVLMVRSASLMASPAHAQCFLWGTDDEQSSCMVSIAHVQGFFWGSDDAYCFFNGFPLP